jgi:hypothetical protein
VATTTTSATGGVGGPGPDWGALANRATTFLEALAATVTPSRDAQLVTDYYDALTGALGRPQGVFTFEVDRSKKVVTVYDAPSEAAFYRLGDFGPGGKRSDGSYTSNTIPLGSADPAKPFAVELYDADKILIARGVSR